MPFNTNKYFYNEIATIELDRPLPISVKQEPAKYEHCFHPWYWYSKYKNVDFLHTTLLYCAQHCHRPLFELSLHQVKTRKTIWCSNISIALSVLLHYFRRMPKVAVQQDPPLQNRQKKCCHRLYS